MMMNKRRIRQCRHLIKKYIYCKKQICLLCCYPSLNPTFQSWQDLRIKLRKTNLHSRNGVDLTTDWKVEASPKTS